MVAILKFLVEAVLGLFLMGCVVLIVFIIAAIVAVGIKTIKEEVQDDDTDN